MQIMMQRDFGAPSRGSGEARGKGNTRTVLKPLSDKKLGKLRRRQKGKEQMDVSRWCEGGVVASFYHKLASICGGLIQGAYLQKKTDLAQR